MALRSIFELGVDEAFEILTGHFAIGDLPPLEAIENEDWGRDMLLGRFLEFSPDDLEGAGLTLSDAGNQADNARDGLPG